ncbi:crotonase/enoyl-CoA hydratase family protein [Pseudonocardia thermophila]|uniref:crotonase/enoyl-CoA hydratase family protein n=1 Tax=Pseudonocardia thermophila TaxID=1848 RepID=UPI00248D80F8|nr:crotonase/enoyl-CoA hydratase family protein [Pseudonocardia thermophila]
MTEPVLVREAGPVLVVTLNRPAVRNAIDLRMAEALSRAMDELDARDDLRAGVITGAGGHFSAGMDLRAFARGERPVVPGKGFAGIVARPPDTPLVAAIEGYALAGGFEIALCADVLVAARDARFGLPEVRRGLIASGGALMRLPRRIPHHAAMELILTGATVDAAWAHRYGLVTRLVEPGTALDAALALATEIAGNGPLALRASKQIVRRSADWPQDEQFARQREWSEPVATSADAREGARAFAEKRAPEWTGT